MATYSSALPDRARVGGSGFTAFFWQGKPLGFCRQIAHTSAPPVGPGPTPIQPLDEPYPIDIVTPAAQTIGTLVLEMYELYNRKIWDHLAGVQGELDIVNVFIQIAASPDPITVVKVIQPPRLRGKAGEPYFEQFHNCVITNIEDGETVEIGTMEITKRITVAYTHLTRSGAWRVKPKDNLAREMAANRLGEAPLNP